MTNTFPGSQSILLSPVLTQPYLVPSIPPPGGFWPWLPVQVSPQALLLPHFWKAGSSVAIWMKICLLPTSISWPLSPHLPSPDHFPLTFHLLTTFPSPSISWPFSPYLLSPDHFPLTFHWHSLKVWGMFLLHFSNTRLFFSPIMMKMFPFPPKVSLYSWWTHSSLPLASFDPLILST